MQQMIAFGLVSMVVAMPTPIATPDGEIAGRLKTIGRETNLLTQAVARLPVDVVKKAAKRAANATKPHFEDLVHLTGHALNIFGGYLENYHVNKGPGGARPIDRYRYQ